MNLSNVFKMFLIYINLLYLMAGSSTKQSRQKRDLLLPRQFPVNPMTGLMMLLPLALALRKSRSFALLLPIPVPMRNQQQPPVYEKQGGNKGDLMLMMMMMMTMMKNMEGKPSHPWAVSTNWPPPPTGNPWPTTTPAPVKDPWPTPVKDPWPSPVKDPWPKPPSDPWTTTTPAPDPWATKPSNPWDTKPSDPWAAKPSDPWATKPSNPWESKPSNPWDTAKGAGNPWDQNKGSNPWDQGNDKGGGSFWDKLKAANPWEKLKAANPWDQGNNKGGNPWGQLKQANPWDPVDDAKRKVAADFGYGDMTNGQYAAMVNQMAEMLKYYMKNVTTTPAPGGKIDDCPKCAVQVNINNSNASPRHNQTQSTSYAVKKRTKESKIKAAPSDPSEPEAPPEDDIAPVEGEEPPIDPEDPADRPIQGDPPMDGVLGGGEVDLDGDGLPDPLGQQLTRYGNQKQYLARKRKDQARPRRLRGHTLGSSMILPHEPYNGARYAVPVKQGQHLSAIQRYQSSGAPSPSLPIAGHKIVLGPYPSPVVPIIQPGYTDRTLAYTQALSGDTYGPQQSIHGHLLQSQNSQGPAVVRFVPVRPVEQTDSSYGYINQFGQKMGQSQTQHSSSTDQIDKSKYEIFRNSESQRELDYLTESPNYSKESGQSETMSTTNNDEDVIIEKPVLGKPPPVHREPMEFKVITGSNDRPNQPQTSPSQSLPSTPSQPISTARVESRMDYQDTNLPMMDKPVYVQHQSVEHRPKFNQNAKFNAVNKVIREPTPTPSASQPKAISLMETSSLPPGRHNFRANGLSPSPSSISVLSEPPSTEINTFSTRSNFRVNDGSKQFRPTSVDPSSSNGVKDSIKLSSLPTSKPFSNNSRNETLINPTTTLYSYPSSVESSSSTSSFPTLPINSFSKTISFENESQLADKTEKFDSFIDQKNDLRINQENGTYLWKEISDNLDAIDNSNYNSKLSDKTNPTKTIAMDRFIDYDLIKDNV